MTLTMQAPPHVVAFTFVGSTLALVATVNQYFRAPLTAIQLNVGVVVTPVDPFPGLLKTGAVNNVARAAVVYAHSLDNSLPSIGLTLSSNACTSQKYIVPFASIGAV